MAANLWGVEQINQWYLIYAYATDSTSTFALKAMPIFRVESQAGQVITTGTINNPAVQIGYTFVTNELANYKLYFFFGASRGLLRTITANNNSAVASTITYSGAALTVAQGDWFVILPNTNFRWLGSVYNNAAGNIVEFVQQGQGNNEFWWNVAAGVQMNAPAPAVDVETVPMCDPLATFLWFRCVTIYVDPALPSGLPATMMPAFALNAPCYYGSEYYDGVNYNGLSGSGQIPIEVCLYRGSPVGANTWETGRPAGQSVARSA